MMKEDRRAIELLKKKTKKIFDTDLLKSETLHLYDNN